MTTSETITDTDRYPVFASKTAFLTQLEQHVRSGTANPELLREDLYRLSNTDTDNWSSDSTARHDD